VTAIQALSVAHPHVFAAGPSVRLVADGDGDLGAGFIAFVVVVALSIACYFLFKSMSRHLRNVPATFDPPAAEHVPTIDPDQK
jgi:hypothetical protein